LTSAVEVQDLMNDTLDSYSSRSCCSLLSFTSTSPAHLSFTECCRASLTSSAVVHLQITVRNSSMNNYINCDAKYPECQHVVLVICMLLLCLFFIKYYHPAGLVSVDIFIAGNWKINEGILNEK
jgi:hypothetical protein